MAFVFGPITVTDRALDYAGRNGGAIYLWGSGGGGGWTFVHAAVDRPWGMAFETLVERPVLLAVADNIAPFQVTVDARRWPRRGLSAVGGPPAGGGVDSPGIAG
jgi:hypothetical protein